MIDPDEWLRQEKRRYRDVIRQHENQIRATQGFAISIMVFVFGVTAVAVSYYIYAKLT